jgi:hypothetical protein
MLWRQAYPFNITLKEYGFNNWQKMPSMPSPRGGKERGACVCVCVCVRALGEQPQPPFTRALWLTLSRARDRGRQLSTRGDGLRQNDVLAQTPATQGVPCDHCTRLWLQGTTTPSLARHISHAQRPTKRVVLMRVVHTDPNASRQDLWATQVRLSVAAAEGEHLEPILLRGERGLPRVVHPRPRGTVPPLSYHARARAHAHRCAL